jgi:GINS complex subunit 2
METLVQILPRFEIGALRFVEGIFGPFAPNYPTRVPLWLALFLRGANTCAIEPPPELNAAALKRILDFEESHGEFHPLSADFFSMARVFLRYAAVDVPDAAEVHRLLDRVEACRARKLHETLQQAIAKGDPATFPPAAISMTSFTHSELLAVRTTLARVLQDVSELRTRAELRPTRLGAAAAAAAARTVRTAGLSATATTPSGTGTDVSAVRPHPEDSSAAGTRSTATWDGQGGVHPDSASRAAASEDESAPQRRRRTLR